ncbi:MAG TPA: class I SAM-dependent methyltransferase [Candidatus Woesebacteria bacterium]|jgi:ubiquinone/menaquinone biosynthesis C-methylase UbiE|nr:class I SAM-dependent methyltransferase [Candidatus Woesebacteria bacterium]HNS65851.1 class I SAM-dependent methyltransferase [Candidatus Woesebacteria bacterium]
MQKKPFVEGNLEDKYNAKNPVSKYLMQRFLRSFEQLLVEVKKQERITTICEVGCGEGELLKILHTHFPKAKLYACDLASNEIAKAKCNTQELKVTFTQQNAESLHIYADQQFDLVVCCEVLEHLEQPKKGLAELKRIGRTAVVSVPVEPLWRFLNLLRFKYVKHLGNTPGHLNHWSTDSFQNLLRKRSLKVLQSKFPLPWQMYLFEAK